jgi:hypothetical protein
MGTGALAGKIGKAGVGILAHGVIQTGARPRLVRRRVRAACYVACGLAVALSLFNVFQFGAAARGPEADWLRERGFGEGELAQMLLASDGA